MRLSPHNHESPNRLKTKISSWFLSLTPTCREVAQLTSEGRDHPLPLGMRTGIGLHRSFCKWCARYAKQLELVNEASELFPEHLDELDGPALDNDAKTRMKRALRDQLG